MGYHLLDMTAYARLDEYNYFRSLAYPYVGVTVNADITPLHARVRAEGLPFFLSLLYVTSRAANSIAAFRQRLRADGIVEYDNCPTSHTVSLGGGRYCYCMLRADCPFDVFLPVAMQAQEALPCRQQPAVYVRQVFCRGRPRAAAVFGSGQPRAGRRAAADRLL